MKKIKLLLIIVLLLGTATAFPKISVSSWDSAELEQQEQVIVYALPFDFTEYSFWTAKSYVTKQWIGATSASLYKLSASTDAEYVRDLADGTPYNPTDDTSGLTKIVQLKEDLRFWNGASLTVDDIVFSYHVALTPTFNKATYLLFAEYFESNSSISVESYTDQTIRFEFSRTYAFWEKLFSLPIVQKSAYQERYDKCLAGNAVSCDWNTDDGSDANSAGPFYIESLDLINMAVTVTKNPYYWDAEKTWASQIIYQKIENKDAAVSALAAGDIDIMDSQYGAVENEFPGLGNILYTIIGDPSIQEISLNHKHPAWGTGTQLGYSFASQQANRSALNVRKAMSHIVNRTGFVTQILKGVGEAASSAMPSAILGHLDASELPPRSYNITLARRYMKEAGYDVPVINSTDPQAKCTVGSNCAFEITVLSPNTYLPRNQWSSAYVNELPKIGIGVNQHVIASWVDITSRTFGYTGEGNPGVFSEGGYDIVFIGNKWGLDWDPTNIYSKSGLCSNSGSCTNFYNYINKTIEEMIFNYTTEIEIAKRMEAVEVLQRGLFSDIPAIPIVYPQSHWAWGNNLIGIDAILISISNQEWEDIRKYEWLTPFPSSVNSPRNSIAVDPVTVCDFDCDASGLEEIIPVLVLVSLVFIIIGSIQAGKRKVT